MTRRMSCSLTIDAVKARTKTVTRRRIDTWRDLKPGDHLTLIEKGMGLPKGAKQVVLAEVEVVTNATVPLHWIEGEGELAAEGFLHLTPYEFAEMWCKTHGYHFTHEWRDITVRLIEWRYL